MADPALPAIRAIETLEVRVPRSARNRITTSYATLPDAHHALVRVHADEFTGIGEAPAELWWTGEDATSVRNAIARYLAPPLIGAPLAPREAVRAMDAALSANAYAKAAVEMALWDLLGRILGVSVGTLLGGHGASVPVKYVIGIVSPERAREEASWALAEGFTVLKIKAGGPLSADLDRLAAVVDVAAGRARVGVDVNGGWDLPTAIAALPPLAELDLLFLEQPVSARHPDAMRALTARSPIPIVAHESMFTLRDAADAGARALAHVWALTPSTHGGIVPTLDMLGVARAHGIPCLLGGTVELGVATAMLAQLGSAMDTIRDCPVPSDVIGPLYHDADIVSTPLRIEEGRAFVPAGAGLGVELDEDALGRFGVDGWR
jgi:L-alanine-DL-glutamate epimerase-like enolase superfamily enzyme